jgi:hypothetical protein
MMSVPTDCPQRDERRGWSGDAALSADETLFNFDFYGFYTSWLVQWRIEQGEVLVRRRQHTTHASPLTSRRHRIPTDCSPFLCSAFSPLSKHDMTAATRRWQSPVAQSLCLSSLLSSALAYDSFAALSPRMAPSTTSSQTTEEADQLILTVGFAEQFILPTALVPLL